MIPIRTTTDLESMRCATRPHGYPRLRRSARRAGERPRAQKQKTGLVPTAALGTALRHAGPGRKVLILQSIEGTPRVVLDEILDGNDVLALPPPALAKAADTVTKGNRLLSAKGTHCPDTLVIAPRAQL
jgi:hypothetical protein